MLSISYLFESEKAKAATKSGLISGGGSALMTYLANKDAIGAEEAVKGALKFGSKVGGAMAAFTALTHKDPPKPSPKEKPR